MGLVAIINFFLSIVGCIITIIIGSLIVRHRKVIEYLRRFFTFIRKDYLPENDANNDINRSVILIGKMVIVSGVLGIIAVLVGFVWMFS